MSDGSLTAQMPAPTQGHAAFIAEVDAAMLELLDAHAGPIAEAARDSVASGGKRLRPLLAWVGSPTASRENPQVRAALVRSAAAIELIHTASLVHDDLLDGAPLRRGIPTVAATSGPEVAIPAGDLLFSVAFTSLAACEHLVGLDVTRACVAWLAETAKELAEGEALQARQTAQWTLSADEYLHRCRLKTGTLFGAAMRIGALCGGATHSQAELLRIFGTDIGVAFQIVDDVLDVTGTAPRLGKEPGADLRDGTVTLPTLLALHERPDLAQAIPAALDRVDGISDLLVQVRATQGPVLAGQRAQALAAAAWQRVQTLQADGGWDLSELERVRDAAVTRLT